MLPILVTWLSSVVRATTFPHPKYVCTIENKACTPVHVKGGGRGRDALMEKNHNIYYQIGGEGEREGGGRDELIEETFIKIHIQLELLIHS